MTKTTLHGIITIDHPLSLETTPMEPPSNATRENTRAAGMQQVLREYKPAAEAEGHDTLSDEHTYTLKKHIGEQSSTPTFPDLGGKARRKRAREGVNANGYRHAAT